MKRARRKRKKFSTKAQLAMALLCVRNADGSPLIPDVIKAKGVDSIVSAVQWDHVVALGLGGADEIGNFQPLLVLTHRAKSKRDVAMMAKARRLNKADAIHRARMEGKAGRGSLASHSGGADAEQMAPLLAGVHSRTGTKTLNNSSVAADSFLAEIDGRPVARARPKRKMQSRGFQGSRSFKGAIRWNKDRKKPE